MVRRAVLEGDPAAAADAVALHYAADDEPGITRQRSGRGFRYTSARGKPVRDAATLARIRALAIPPAWTRVWISPDPEGHVQATGRDARGRKQYRYHPRWREVRDEAKYGRFVEFCHALPTLRRAVTHDLACACLCKRKVVATVVKLMEEAQLRVGNDEYARQNGSYGATTLRNHHARVRGDTLELAFRGKGGLERHVRVTDRRLARIVRRCLDLPGQRLFQYVDDEAHEVHPITSNDVNDYLREVTGGPFTAKDYRTWAATLSAAALLCAVEHPHTERACKQCITQAISAVAERLGHTPAVCRTSYIHPRLLEDFTSGALTKTLRKQLRPRLGRGKRITIDVGTLRATEHAVARYLGRGTSRRKAP